MPWNLLAITMTASEGFGSPMYGTGDWTYDEARAEVQQALEKHAKTNQAFATLAETWRQGAADDTVYTAVGPGALVVYAIYEYPEDEDPVHKALEWLDDFSKRATGRPAQMIVPPTAPGGTFSS
jgi:hypothetical protein